MELKELLAWFDQGGPFGEDAEVVAAMRRCIQENRRLLFEMNQVWHEDEAEITALFARITAKPVGEGVRIETPFYTDFGKNISLGNHVFMCLSTPAANFRTRAASSSETAASLGTTRCWPRWTTTWIRRSGTSSILPRSTSAPASGSARTWW